MFAALCIMLQRREHNGSKGLSMLEASLVLGAIAVLAGRPMAAEQLAMLICNQLHAAAGDSRVNEELHNCISDPYAPDLRFA